MKPDCPTETDGASPPRGQVRSPVRRRWVRRAVVIGLVLLTAAGLQWRRQIGLAVLGRWYAAKADGPVIHDVSELLDSSPGAAVIVDVRTDAEYRVSRVAGARHLPLAELEKNGWPADWSTDRPVITYCTVGYRSGVAARALAERGLDARSLVGGILALAQAGAPLVDDDGATVRVHVADRSFAWLVPPPYAAVLSD